jgi:hypothetical protein
LILFLLFSIPLTYLLVNNFFNNRNILKRSLLMPFIYGMALSIPILLLYWSFFQSFFNNWTSAGLFFYYFFNIDGIFGIYIIAIICLLFVIVEKPMEASRLREITAYVMGLYFTIAIYDSLMQESWYGSLELFILPLLRISSAFLISIFLNRALTFSDWKRYLWIGSALLIPVLMVFVPLMSVVNMNFVAVIVSITLLTASTILYILEIEGRFLT